MAQATLGLPPQIPAVPSDATQLRNTVVRFAEAINNILRGGIGCTMLVTLAPNATTSTFNDSRIGPYTSINLVPVTWHASNALPSIYIVNGLGNCTIHHANSPNTDATFIATLIG